MIPALLLSALVAGEGCHLVDDPGLLAAAMASAEVAVRPAGDEASSKKMAGVAAYEAQVQRAIRAFRGREPAVSFRNANWLECGNQGGPTVEYLIVSKGSAYVLTDARGLNVDHPALLVCKIDKLVLFTRRAPPREGFGPREFPFRVVASSDTPGRVYLGYHVSGRSKQLEDYGWWVPRTDLIPDSEARTPAQAP